MLEVARELQWWVEEGREFAVATVVAVGGSAPRQPGASLAVDADGAAIGSVSGGCVEGAVYELSTAYDNGMIEVDGVPINAAPAYDPGHGWLGAAETALLTLSEFRRQAETRRKQKAQPPA